MDKINFQDLPSTQTPIDARNMNLLQNNVETAIDGVQTNLDNNIKEYGVVVSPTEPTGNARKKVWLRHSSNMFDVQTWASKGNNPTYYEYSNGKLNVIELDGRAFSNFTPDEKIILPNGTYTISGYTGTGLRIFNTGDNNYVSTATFEVTLGYIYLKLVSYDTPVNNLQPIINKGSTSLPYEPYAENKTYILNDNNVYEKFNATDEYTEYEITNTPLHSAGTNTYQLAKSNKFCNLNAYSIWLNSITQETWVTLGNLPAELKPNQVRQGTCIVVDGNGTLKGYAAIQITTNGEIKAKTTYNASSLTGFVGINIGWFI